MIVAEMSWLYGLIGGLMIGCAGAVLLLGTGRVMGASGIIGGLVDGTGRDRSTSAAFLLGLVGMPAMIHLLGWQVDTQAGRGSPMAARPVTGAAACRACRSAALPPRALTSARAC